MSQTTKSVCVWPPVAQAQTEPTSERHCPCPPLRGFPEERDLLVHLHQTETRVCQSFLCSTKQTGVIKGSRLHLPPQTASGLHSSRARMGRPRPVPNQPVPPKCGCLSVLSFQKTPLRTSSEPSTVLAIEGRVLTIIMILFFFYYIISKVHL